MTKIQNGRLLFEKSVYIDKNGKHIKKYTNIFENHYQGL